MSNSSSSTDKLILLNSAIGPHCLEPQKENEEEDEEGKVIESWQNITYITIEKNSQM